MSKLAIDCATGPASISLEVDGQYYTHTLLEKGTQAADLLPAIKTLYAEAESSLDTLETVICTVGPGSFTGIRIGLTVARILCYTLGAEGIGVSTLQGYALGKDGAVITKAGKGQAFIQHFKQGDPIDAISLIPLDSAPIDAAGNLNSNAPVDTEALLRHHTQLKETLPLEPLYIREPDAEPATPLTAR